MSTGANVGPEPDLTEIGFESSLDFSFGQAQQISQDARVFATKAQADSSWMPKALLVRNPS